MITTSHTTLPYLGFGLGLRTQHYETILTQQPPVDWFEIISENYLIPGGKPLHFLDKIRELYPMVMHGVSLSIGSSDPLDKDYLKQLKTLVQRVDPCWVSDHLCWTGVSGLNMHDLLPIPYTRQAVEHIVARIQTVQEYLKKPMLIENVSSYLSYKQSEMSEWEFINDIVYKSGCYLLLDVNNVYVSAVNHEFDPLTYIHAMPRERVAQIHLAGHSHQDNYIIDTHDAAIIEEVWDLYAHTIAHIGPVSTMIERDDNIPSFETLWAELQQAKQIAHRVLQDVVC